MTETLFFKICFYLMFFTAGYLVGAELEKPPKYTDRKVPLSEQKGMLFSDIVNDITNISASDIAVDINDTDRAAFKKKVQCLRNKTYE